MRQWEGHFTYGRGNYVILHRRRRRHRSIKYGFLCPQVQRTLYFRPRVSRAIGGRNQKPPWSRAGRRARAYKAARVEMDAPTKSSTAPLLFIQVYPACLSSKHFGAAAHAILARRRGSTHLRSHNNRCARQPSQGNVRSGMVRFCRVSCDHQSIRADMRRVLYQASEGGGRSGRGAREQLG